MSILKVGDKAPDFSTLDQHAQRITLSQFMGKKVALYFYPKDATPGCTAEACNLKDNYEALQAKGYEILGVSTDSVKSHAKFATKYELPFSLLADEDQIIVNAYGVWIEKSMYGRSYMGTNRVTFLIDEQGNIEHIIDKVKTKEHAEQILAL